ncbi:YafY family protein [Paenibacillus sp. L3-i20]|uniref:helix-turn-helix transcriptional regulator n=1 Tax=Paenibacillus sp. L3-i20 TaxID=2905833 RepID=UPI001EDF9BAB|nr:WYL domain-containing protein [Paenibacillus sp. L3-i20]GKU79161.1 DeoR family transcriptional regulator [Paenibacillus sp. L3-i20]
MKRSDRLMAIIIALQQRSETAQSLATKFEVSKRTILRDMQALSEIGIPLYASTGPSGGFKMMDGYQLPPLQFDAQEALTILFALNALTKLKDTPFKQARWTVMDKIRATLPTSLIEKVEPMLERLDMDVPIRTQETPLLEELLSYLSDSSWIHVNYRSERNQRWLQLHPERVYTAYGFWYCEAYSIQHEERRTFRIDRFFDIKKADNGQVTKPNCDMPLAGERKVTETIFIHAKLSYRGALIAEQDPDIGQYVRHVDENEWQLSFNCPISEWKWAISFFYKLGLDAEVIEPLSLKDELFELASQICNRYRSV